MRELLGWLLLLLGAGALQLPALGRMAQQGVDILEFELMRTSVRASQLLAYLGADGIAAARQQLYLDFGLLILYAVVLVAACTMLAARPGADTWVGKLGHAVARLAVVAAACDAIENVALLVVLAGETDQPWPGIASTFATVKFALLAIVLTYLVVGFLATWRAERAQSVP